MVLERPLSWTAWALDGADAARLLKPQLVALSPSTAASSPRYEGHPQGTSIAVWHDTRSLTEDLRRPRAEALPPWVGPLQLEARPQQAFAEAAMNRLAWLQAEKEALGKGSD